MGNLEGWMHPVQRYSSRNVSSSFCSSRFRGYTLHLIGSEPGFNSIAWSQGQFGGKVSNLVFSNTSSNPLYCSGMGSVLLFFSNSSANTLAMDWWAHIKALFLLTVQGGFGYFIQILLPSSMSSASVCPHMVGHLVILWLWPSSDSARELE